jgi:hypothetical protein
MAESDCEVGVISDWGRRSGWNSSGGRKQTVVTVDKDRRIRWATVDRRRTEKVVESHAQDGITGEASRRTQGRALRRLGQRKWGLLPRR